MCEPATSRPLPVAVAFAAVFMLAGCPDPNAEYDEFVKRHEDIYGMGTGPTTTVGAGGGCAVPMAGELDGDYFFALVAAPSPGKPAPLRATLTTTDGAAGLEFSLDLQPLNADDRVTNVEGPFSLGPFPVGMDGSIDADWGSIVIPPDTNPISASELVANVQIVGSLCPSAFFCGAANGAVTAPVDLPLDGSTWTMEPMDTFSEPPKLNCAGDLADPL